VFRGPYPLVEQRARACRNSLRSLSGRDHCSTRPNENAPESAQHSHLDSLPRARSRGTGPAAPAREEAKGYLGAIVFNRTGDGGCDSLLSMLVTAGIPAVFVGC
jgi:hypothetical protein